MKILASSVTALAIVAVPIALAASPANTQITSPVGTQATVCWSRDDVIGSLNMQYRESQLATGVLDPQTVLEVYVSHAGSWTLVATGTDGNSCILFFGEDWDSKSTAIGIDA